MTRRRFALLNTSAALVLFSAVGVGWLLLGQPAPSANGPMRPVPEHGIVAKGASGDTFTEGTEMLLLGGDESAELVRVQSVGGEGTFRQTGAMVAGPGRKFAFISYVRDFPPRDKTLGELSEAEGAVLKPKGQTRNEFGYELLVGYEILDDTKVGYRSGLKVTYRVGGELFEWSSPARMLYCPTSMKSEECYEVAERDDWGE